MSLAIALPYVTKRLGNARMAVIDAKQKQLAAIISAEVVDRDGEVLVSKGIKADTYLAYNPVVFWGHQSRDLPIGRTLDIDVLDKEVAALVQFAGAEQLHPQAETIYRLYRDKFLSSWSIGFRPIKTSYDKVLPGQTGKTVWEFELMELSAVGIPSNYKAVSQMAKSFALPDGATEDDLAEALGMVPLQQYWPVAEKISSGHSAPSGLAPAPARSQSRRSSIILPGQQRRHTLPAEAGRKDMPMTPEDRTAVKEVMLEVIKPVVDRVTALEGPRRLASGQVFPLGGPPGVIHSRGEAAYSLMAAVKSLQSGDKTKAPLAWALSEKLEQAGYTPAQPGSLLVPLCGDLLWRMPGYEALVDSIALETKQSFALRVDPGEVAAARRAIGVKAMDPLDETGGGSLIAFPEMGELITLLRPASVISAAGARALPLPPQGSIHYPKSTGDPTFTWLAPGVDIPDSRDQTGALTLTAKRAAAIVKLPNDLVRYSAGIADALVREALMARSALTEDLAFLEGAGGTGVPLGLTNYPRSATDTPTRDQVTLHVAGTTGASGDTFMASDVLTMMGLVEEAPDPVGPTSWIMRPLMFAGLANARADQGGGAGTGAFMFPITRGELGGAIRKELAGLPVFVSTQVSKTHTKGSGTNLTYVVCGNFNNAIVARVAVMELQVSTEAGFIADATWLRSIIRVDFGLAHPESFCVTDQLVIPT